MPRPCIEDVRERLLTYPEVPKPCIEDVRERLLTYPEVPRPWIEDVVPVFNPTTVEVRERLLT